MLSIPQQRYEAKSMSRHFLIIGASSGIGAALLESLAASGASVTHASREPERAPDLPGTRGVRWDLLTEPFPADALPERLDGVAYCPGGIRLKPFARLREQDFNEEWELNVLGTVRALQAALPALERAETASVLLFSTVAVQTGMPFHAAVGAAKGAVEGLTRSLAAELAPRIRVNAIAPTLTDTPLAARLLGSDEKRAAAAERHPLKRICEPAEIARTGAWLLNEAVSVTGQVIPVDAGLSGVRRF
jgi:NAD(P)-dependent dehydrogenase (short-subunit alcohol dehydrogenase family)